MRVIFDRIQPDAVAETLVVCLPGAYDTPEDFQGAGFVDAVRERDLPLDVALADMNLEYITDGTALSLLRDNVIQPAQAAGYRRIWLTGISIGGFMAVLYADRHPGAITGLSLIAPYPGNRVITGEIAAAGGILGWSPDGIAEDDHERRVWQWLKHHGNHLTTVHLGYGNRDRFSAAHADMSTALPQNRVQVVTGGHDWPTWREIWLRFLDGGALTR